MAEDQVLGSSTGKIRRDDFHRIPASQKFPLWHRGQGGTVGIADCREVFNVIVNFNAFDLAEQKRRIKRAFV